MDGHTTTPPPRNGPFLSPEDGNEAPPLSAIKIRQKSTYASLTKMNAGGVPDPTPPRNIVFHKPTDDDTVGMRAIFESLSNIQTFSFVRAAFRTTAFVAFPMFTISIHPNTMTRLGLPQMVIAAVMSTSTSRGTLGEQIGLHSWVMRGVTYMLILSTVFETFHLYQTIGAWWGLTALSVFIASLVSNGMMRRFMYIYIFVYLMSIRLTAEMFGEVKVGDGAWLAGDLYMGTCFGIAATLFPYPALMRVTLDMIMGKLFTGIGTLLMGMQAFVWSEDVHSAAVFYSDMSPFASMEDAMNVLPTVLWFVNWEPTEFATRNPIRRIKLTFLRRVMALTYAAFGAGQTVVRLRKEKADRVAMAKIRAAVQAEEEERRYGAQSKLKQQKRRASCEGRDLLLTTTTENIALVNHVPFGELDVASEKTSAGSAAATSENDSLEMARAEALRLNARRHVHDATAALVKALGALGGPANTPEEVLATVPFADLEAKERQMRRNLRVQMLNLFRMNVSQVDASIRKKQQQQEQQQQQQQRENRSRLERRRSSGAPYGEQDDRAIGGAAEPPADSGHFVELQKLILESVSVIPDIDLFIEMNILFFHLLMGMIAAEIETFGEQMRDYAPEHGLCRRLWMHFIQEPWHDFWEELWCHLTFARPSDIRIYKDAVKMVVAFLSAMAMNFEVYVEPGGVYYFGTTILLGLPQEEESLGISVCRLAGNCLGCALGFLAMLKAQNLAQAIATCLCFCFLFLSMRNNEHWGQALFYASFITLAGAVTAIVPGQLLTRYIMSNFSIMSYTIACLVIFPTNAVKIYNGYRVKYLQVLCETAEDAAEAVRCGLPPVESATTTATTAGLTAEKSFQIDSTSPDERPIGADDAQRANRTGGRPVMVSREVQPSEALLDKLQGLNINLDVLSRLGGQCHRWGPWAARQPMIRGTEAFPKAASREWLAIQGRLTAHMKLLVFGIQLLLRTRRTPVSPRMTAFVSGPLADFMGVLAACLRQLGQDYVNAAHRSRVWSRRAARDAMGHTSRLHLSFRMLSYECGVILARAVAAGTTRLHSRDVDYLNREHSARWGGGDDAEASMTVPYGAVADGDGGGGGDTPTEATHAERPPLSFADLYLNSRRFLVQLSPRSARGAGSGPHHDHEAIPSVSGGHDGGSSVCLEDGGGVVNLSMMLSPPDPDADARPDGWRATLVESTAVAPDAYPHTQPVVGPRAIRQGGRETGVLAGDAAAGAAAAAPAPSAATDGADGGDRSARGPSHYPARPAARSASTILRHFRQPYTGPGFSYHADALDLPIDTDGNAIVVVLTSCEGLMRAMEELLPAVDRLNSHQRQLHESSVAVPLLDRLSGYLKQRRWDTFRRYHPTDAWANPGEVNIPIDPYHQWSV